MNALTELMRRMRRKLDIQRGLSLSYDDLAILVETGAIDALREAADDEERASLPLPKLPRGRKADPFVYFIRAADGPIKIGLSRKVVERQAGLQICCPDELTVLATIQAPKEAEWMLHAHFAPERIRGEWFRASPRLLAYVGSLQ